MIRMDMSARRRTPVEEVEAFAAELHRYVKQSRDGVVLIQSEVIRDAVLDYERDIKYSVNQVAFARGLLAVTLALDQQVKTKTSPHSNEIRTIVNRFIVAQESFEHALMHPNDLSAKTSAKNAFFEVCESTPDAASQAWAVLESAFDACSVDSEKRTRAHLDFLEFMMVDTISMEFIKNAMYLKQNEDVGFSPRTYHYDPIYTRHPRSWKENTHFTFLPTLQSMFDHFQNRLSVALRDNPDDTIKNWFERNKPIDNRSDVIDNQVDIEEQQSSKALFYVLVLVLACILIDLQYRITTAKADKRLTVDEYSDPDAEANESARQTLAVLFFGCSVTALAYCGDLFGVARRSVESVSQAMRLSLAAAERANIDNHRLINFAEYSV